MACACAPPTCACRWSPGHSRAWGYLGLAFQRLGDYERALPAHDAVQDVGARLKTENLVLERQRTGVLAVEGSDLNIH